MESDEANATRARAEAVLAVLERAGAAPAVEFLRRGLPQAGQPFQRGVFFGVYAGAARRLRQPLAIDKMGQRQLSAAGFARPASLGAAELARAALLLSACAVLPASEHVALATEAFRKGDNDERAALLRALPLLPAPARFAELAIEACRTHVPGVFAAIACDNPFPASHFAMPNFNQLVMKSLFMELPLERVIGWRKRVGPELQRMAHDYEAERVAAGRSVPSDIALLKAAAPAADAGTGRANEEPS
jgi:hypothetical protein